MREYLSPMEGITGDIYRRTYHKYFYPMDKYFTPFLTAKPQKKLSTKEIYEVAPSFNEGIFLVPQILGNNAEDFMHLAGILKNEYGYRELNLNLGCPSGTVTAKGKGAGFLSDPMKLERFLDQIYSALDVKLSIKTRIGIDEEEDWDDLLNVYRKFPISELIIHPRLLIDHYKGTIHLDAFQKALESLEIPLCYNGDLFYKNDVFAIQEKIKSVDCIMYGRGAIRNPFLPGMAHSDEIPDASLFEAFHDELLDAYSERLSGDRNVLFRMKELWAYWGKYFIDCDKQLKKIRKSQKISEYKVIALNLIRNCEMKGDH
ncbi:MAG: tRNA-dihydrouridine synthase family protein [Eubacteriales bacterium]|nr:tRNA-dihydrouridine synthase family protein [Eubacteriales bacterium]